MLLKATPDKFPGASTADQLQPSHDSHSSLFLFVSMVGSVKDVDTEKIEPLPEYYFKPTAVMNEPVVEEGNGNKRDIVVGRNVHSTCLDRDRCRR